MSALFDITQNTLGPGLGPGEAREDGVPGELVTITIQDPTVQEVQVLLEWTPPDDEVAFFNLAVNPSDIKEFTFTPDANAVNASGTYLIHVITDAGNPARRDEALLAFVITTPNSGLVIPALNEPGNPLASLTQPDAPGAANNVPFLGPGRNVPGSPIADIDFAAWWKAVSNLILVVDGFSGGAGEVNTGVDVGTGVGISDGANIGVQLPMRSVGGINDVGVALNGQTIEVDGILLLDLTAVRHVTGPAPLTLEYATRPTIQWHDNGSGDEIDKRWGIQAEIPDGPPQFSIGALPSDGAFLDTDNAGLILVRAEGTANIELTELLGETVRLRSSQLTGGGTVLIQPDSFSASDEYPLLTMRSNGTFNSTVIWHVGDRTPVGNVTANPGDFYVRSRDGVNSTFYQHNGAVANNTSWAEIGASAAGLQAAYNADPSILLAGNTAISVTVPVGHTAAALDINLDSTFAPVTAGDGAVLFRDNGVSRMALGEHPAFGFGLFSIGTGADMVIATDTDGDLTIITQGAGTVTVGAGGTGDANFASEGGDATLFATVGNTTVKAEVNLTLEATTGVFSLDAGGITGALSVTAAGAVSLISPAGGMTLTATTGPISISSLAAGGDVNLTSGLADLFLEATSGTATLTGGTLALISGSGPFTLTVNTNQVIDVTAAGAITLLGVSNQPVTVEAQGTGDLRVRNSGSGVVSLEQTGTGNMTLSTSVGTITVSSEGTLDMESDGGNVVITAGVDMTQTVTGVFTLSVQGNLLLNQVAGGNVSLQSWNDDSLSLISNGTGSLVLNGGTGLVSIIGAAITLSSGAGSDINVTANGAGNIFLNAVGDDIALDSLNLGFYGVTAAPRPDITGSRAGGVALTNLLTALATLGLITDSSTI